MAFYWLQNTLNMMRDEYDEVHEVLGLLKNDVVMLIARCLTKMGRTDEALNILESHPSLADNATLLIDLYKAQPDVPQNLFHTLTKYYQATCRSSHIPNRNILHCRYNSTTTPFLKIAPLKMEEISLDPYIVVYHDVLPDKDIAEVLRLSENKLNPAEVVLPPGTKEKEKFRTALGFWLPDYDEDVNGPPNGPFYHRLRNTLRDVTGLVILDDQFFQVLKYEFGAHYSPHHDYFNMSIDSTLFSGDRIATVLFYVSFWINFILCVVNQSFKA